MKGRLKRVWWWRREGLEEIGGAYDKKNIHKTRSSFEEEKGQQSPPPGDDVLLNFRTRKTPL